MDQLRARSVSPVLLTHSSCHPTRETEVTEADDSFPHDCPSVSEQMSSLIGRQPDCSPGKTFVAPGNRAAVLREMAKSLYHVIPEGRARVKTGLIGRETMGKLVGRRSEIGTKERSSGKSACTEVQPDPISHPKPTQLDAKVTPAKTHAEVGVQTQFPASPDPFSGFESRLQALESLHSPHSPPSPQKQLILDLKAQLACEQSARLQASTALEAYISEVKRLQCVVQCLQQRACPAVPTAETVLRTKQSQVRTRQLVQQLGGLPAEGRSLANRRKRLAVELELGSVETKLRAMQLDKTEGAHPAVH